MPVTVNRAQAAPAPNPYTDVQVSETRDGTGQGTDAGTFLTTANGYPVGDDSPTDGVVSSNDYVEYTVRLSFTAALSRSVRVSWDLSKAPYLEAVDDDSLCSGGRLVTAHSEGAGVCVFTVPTGAVETMTRTIRLKARDTGGTIRRGQQPILKVGLNGQDAVQYRTSPVTVVSAPAADLVVDNGALEGEEREYTWQTVGGRDETPADAKGWFDLKVEPVAFPHADPVKGASTSGKWSATVDVSQFPSGTQWTLEEGSSLRYLYPSDRKLRIENVSGSQRLNWQVPESFIRAMGRNTTRVADIHVIVDPDSFSSDHNYGEQPLLRNLGTGGQPGQDGGKDQSSAGWHGTLSQAGRPYPNDDWSRIRFSHSTIQGKLFDKHLERPTVQGTIFDPASLTFKSDSPADSQDVSHWYDDPTADEVASGTAVRTVIGYHPAWDSRHAGFHPSVVDKWDPAQEKWRGDLKLVQGTTTLSEGRDYTVSWTADNPDSASTTWQSGTPSGEDASRARAVRVTFLDPVLARAAAAGGDAEAADQATTVTVSFQNTVTATADGTRVEDTAEGWFTPGAKSADGTYGGYVRVVKPTKITAKLYYNLSASTSKTVRPGDRVSYEIGPEVNNVSANQTAFTPVVTASLPEGIVDPVNDSDDWTMTVTGSGVNKKLVFTLKSSPITPQISHDGAALPEINWHGRVSNLAAGTLSSTAKMSVHVTPPVGAAVDVTSAPATASVGVNTQAGSAAMVTADRDKVDVGDPLEWTANITSQGTGRTGTTTTVLRLPQNNDYSMSNGGFGPDNSWDYSQYHSKFGYQGYTTMNGSYTLDGPVTTEAGDSTATTVYYTTGTAESGDPSAYSSWKTWDQLTADEKKKITALKVVSHFETHGSRPIAAARLKVKLNPTGDKAGNELYLWPGPVRSSDGTAATKTPWPDRVRVMASTIKGTVWWDDNKDGIPDPSEPRIYGVKVSLWKTDANGTRIGTTPVATTIAYGDYTFTGLHSGHYQTSVARQSGTTTGTGVQTLVNTYYNKTASVSNTYSFNNQRGSHARDDSQTITVGVGETQSGVDFGYSKPNPEVTLDKTRPTFDCGDTSCNVDWDVTITNTGNTSIPAGSAIHDRMSKDVKNVSATLGTRNLTHGVKQLATDGQRSLILMQNGTLYGWGDDTDNMLGFNSNPSSPSTVSTPRVYKAFAQDKSNSGGCLFEQLNGKSEDESCLYAAYTTGELSDINYNIKSSIVSSIALQTSNAGHDKAPATSGEFEAGSTGSDTLGGVYATTPNGSILHPVQPSNISNMTLSYVGSLYPDQHLSGLRWNNWLGIGGAVHSPLPSGVQIVAGNDFTAYLTADGRIFINDAALNWNGSSYTTPDGKSVFVQYYHGGALDDTGHIYSPIYYWDYLTHPGVRYVLLAAGGDNLAAIDSDGNIWTAKNKGPAAYTSGEEPPAPIKIIMSSPAPRFTKVAVSSTHFLALDSQGRLYGWTDSETNPSNLHNAAGPGAPIRPTLINTGTTRFKEISAGRYASYAISKDNHLYSWGWNGDGQLANGSMGAGNGNTADTSADVNSPTDTGILASHVAGGDRNALIASKYVMVAGYDAKGDGRKGTARDLPLLLQGMDMLTDPTAQPISPSSQTDTASDTVRDYSTPYRLDAGGKIVLHLTGTVDRGTAEKRIHNQAWFDSPDTPYAGTPNARTAAVSTPKEPDDSKLDSNSNDITGNSSCMTGTDYGTAASEHTFYDNHEDSCDQVGAVVPALAGSTPPASVTGSISGLYWRDANGDGIRQSSEARIPGQQVVLYTQDGTRVASTTTGSDGSYTFPNVPLGAYRVLFGQVKDSFFTKPDVGDSDPATDMSSTDSDAGTASGTDYGLSTVLIQLTATNRSKEHVDAGVLSVTPKEAKLPMTGLGHLLPLLLLTALILLGVSCALLRKPKGGKGLRQGNSHGTPTAGGLSNDGATSSSSTTGSGQSHHSVSR